MPKNDFFNDPETGQPAPGQERYSQDNGNVAGDIASGVGDFFLGGPRRTLSRAMNQKNWASTYEPSRNNFALGADANANNYTAGAQQQATSLQGTAAAQRAGTLTNQQVAGGYRGQIGDAQWQAGNQRAGMSDALAMGGPQLNQGIYGGQDQNLQEAQAYQRNQINALNQFAQGPQGPSGAQAMLNNATAQTQNRNLALARSARGGASDAGMRAALANNTSAQMQGNNNAAILAAQESAQARGQNLQALTAAQGGAQGMGATAIGARGQDVGLAGQQLGADVTSRGQNIGYAGTLGQQALGYEQVGLGYGNLANQSEQTAIGYGGLANQTGQQALGYEQLGQGYQELGLRGSTGYENLRGGSHTAATIANMQAEQARDAAIMGGGGGLAAGVIGLMSDERSKQRIQELEDINRQQQEVLSMRAEYPTPQQPGGALAGAPDVASRGALMSSEQSLASSSTGAPQATGTEPRNPAAAQQGRGAGMAAYEASKNASANQPDPEQGGLTQQQAMQLYNQVNAGFQSGQGAQQINPMSYAPPVQSDEKSKQQIEQLTTMNRELIARLSGGSGFDGISGQQTVMPDLKQPDYAALEATRQTPAYSYEYKNPDAPGAKPGRQAGIMAQDLEKTPVGQSAVMNTPQGKMIDTPRLTTINTGAINAQQRELDALAEEVSQLRQNPTSDTSWARFLNEAPDRERMDRYYGR